jgi:hypothetical protein
VEYYLLAKPSGKDIKLFPASLMLWQNKLECLSHPNMLRG